MPSCDECGGDTPELHDGRCAWCAGLPIYLTLDLTCESTRGGACTQHNPCMSCELAAASGESSS
jgi:hypothetical protein